MPVIISANTEGYLAVARLYRHTARETEAALAPALNRAGTTMTRTAVTEIADNIGAPDRAVRDGFDVTRALQQNPTFYRLRYIEGRFRYVRWKTKRDEKVCPICRPLHNQLIHKNRIEHLHPAHYGCRCEVVEAGVLEEFEEIKPRLIATAMSEVAVDVMARFEAAWVGGAGGQ